MFPLAIVVPDKYSADFGAVSNLGLISVDSDC